jgi:hypothetical protein
MYPRFVSRRVIVSAWDLRRVVPVAQRVGEVATVTSIELYGNGICVRWLVDQAPADPAERFQTRPRLSDDQGATYIEDAYSMGSWLSGLHGESWFTPALRTAARRLTIAIRDAELEVDL